MPSSFEFESGSGDSEFKRNSSLQQKLNITKQSKYFVSFLFSPFFRGIEATPV